jgi:hypothetical protein
MSVHQHLVTLTTCCAKPRTNSTARSMPAGSEIRTRNSPGVLDVRHKANEGSLCGQTSRIFTSPICCRQTCSTFTSVSKLQRRPADQARPRFTRITRQERWLTGVCRRVRAWYISAIDGVVGHLNLV